MVWDAVTTLRRALWIGGAQWAGKSTVADILTERYGLTQYHYDYHDARGHTDRRLAGLVRRGGPPRDLDWPKLWTHETPEELARLTLAGFIDRFAWVMDDLRALTSPHPVLAEGWGLRPELVAPVAGSVGQMVVLVPTEEFRQEQVGRVPRAMAVSHPVEDPGLVQAKRLARDRLIAADAVRQAELHQIAVIWIDGTVGAQQVADLVAERFEPYLPR